MIVSLSQGSKRQLLIGTKSSSVYLLKHGDKTDKLKTIMSGHSDGMIWCATISGDYLFTGGDDQRLIKWEFRGSKKVIK